jgi:hypothetical protein
MTFGHTIRVIRFGWLRLVVMGRPAVVAGATLQVELTPDAEPVSRLHPHVNGYVGLRVAGGQPAGSGEPPWVGTVAYWPSRADAAPV